MFPSIARQAEQVCEPYAWKCRGVFGVIAHTTPRRLMLMVDAFFSNNLLLDNELYVTKILSEWPALTTNCRGTFILHLVSHLWWLHLTGMDAVRVSRGNQVKAVGPCCWNWCVTSFFTWSVCCGLMARKKSTKFSYLCECMCGVLKPSWHQSLRFLWGWCLASVCQTLYCSLQSLVTATCLVLLNAH